MEKMEAAQEGTQKRPDAAEMSPVERGGSGNETRVARVSPSCTWGVGGSAPEQPQEEGAGEVETVGGREGGEGALEAVDSNGGFEEDMREALAEEVSRKAENQTSSENLEEEKRTTSMAPVTTGDQETSDGLLPGASPFSSPSESPASSPSASSSLPQVSRDSGSGEAAPSDSPVAPPSPLVSLSSAERVPAPASASGAPFGFFSASPRSALPPLLSAPSCPCAASSNPEPRSFPPQSSPAAGVVDLAGSLPGHAACPPADAAPASSLPLATASLPCFSASVLSDSASPCEMSSSASALCLSSSPGRSSSDAPASPPALTLPDPSLLRPARPPPAGLASCAGLVDAFGLCHPRRALTPDLSAEESPAGTRTLSRNADAASAWIRETAGADASAFRAPHLLSCTSESDGGEPEAAPSADGADASAEVRGAPRRSASAAGGDAEDTIERISLEDDAAGGEAKNQGASSQGDDGDEGAGEEDALGEACRPGFNDAGKAEQEDTEVDCREKRNDATMSEQKRQLEAIDDEHGGQLVSRADRVLAPAAEPPPALSSAVAVALSTPHTPSSPPAPGGSSAFRPLRRAGTSLSAALDQSRPAADGSVVPAGAGRWGLSPPGPSRRRVSSPSPSGREPLSAHEQALEAELVQLLHALRENAQRGGRRPTESEAAESDAGESSAANQPEEAQKDSAHAAEGDSRETSAGASGKDRDWGRKQEVEEEAQRVQREKDSLVAKIRQIVLSMEVGLPMDLRGATWKALLGVADEPGDSALAQAVKETALDEPNQRVIRSDVERTRASLAFYRDAGCRAWMEKLLTCYCKASGIKYKQGLNELLAPFLYLKGREGFTVADVFKCFRVFAGRFLSAMFSDDEFTTLQCSFHLFKHLLSYHDPALADFLEVHFVTPELYVTPWFLTLFSSKTSLLVLFALWDKYIAEDDQYFFPFIALALLISFRSEIRRTEVSQLPETLSKITIHSVEQLRHLWGLAKELKAQTPMSFSERLFAAQQGTLTSASPQPLQQLEAESAFFTFPQEVLNHAYGLTGRPVGAPPRYSGSWPPSGPFAESRISCPKPQTAALFGSASPASASSLAPELLSARSASPVSLVSPSPPPCASPSPVSFSPSSSSAAAEAARSLVAPASRAPPEWKMLLLDLRPVWSFEAGRLPPAIHVALLGDWRWTLSALLGVYDPHGQHEDASARAASSPSALLLPAGLRHLAGGFRSTSSRHVSKAKASSSGAAAAAASPPLSSHAFATAGSPASDASLSAAVSPSSSSSSFSAAVSSAPARGSLDERASRQSSRRAAASAGEGLVAETSGGARLKRADASEEKGNSRRGSGKECADASSASSATAQPSLFLPASAQEDARRRGAQAVASLVDKYLDRHVGEASLPRVAASHLACGDRLSAAPAEETAEIGDGEDARDTEDGDDEGLALISRGHHSGSSKLGKSGKGASRLFRTFRRRPHPHASSSSCAASSAGGGWPEQRSERAAKGEGQRSDPREDGSFEAEKAREGGISRNVSASSLSSFSSCDALGPCGKSGTRMRSFPASKGRARGSSGVTHSRSSSRENAARNEAARDSERTGPAGRVADSKSAAARPQKSLWSASVSHPVSCADSSGGTPATSEGETDQDELAGVFSDGSYFYRLCVDGRTRKHRFCSVTEAGKGAFFPHSTPLPSRPAPPQLPSETAYPGGHAVRKAVPVQLSPPAAEPDHRRAEADGDISVAAPRKARRGGWAFRRSAAARDAEKAKGRRSERRGSEERKGGQSAASHSSTANAECEGPEGDTRTADVAKKEAPEAEGGPSRMHGDEEAVGGDEDWTPVEIAEAKAERRRRGERSRHLFRLFSPRVASARDSRAAGAAPETLADAQGTLRLVHPSSTAEPRKSPRPLRVRRSRRGRLLRLPPVCGTEPHAGAVSGLARAAGKGAPARRVASSSGRPALGEEDVQAAALRNCLSEGESPLSSVRRRSRGNPASAPSLLLSSSLCPLSLPSSAPPSPSLEALPLPSAPSAVSFAGRADPQGPARARGEDGGGGKGLRSTSIRSPAPASSLRRGEAPGPLLPCEDRAEGLGEGGAQAGARGRLATARGDETGAPLALAPSPATYGISVCSEAAGKPEEVSSACAAVPVDDRQAAQRRTSSGDAKAEGATKGTASEQDQDAVTAEASSASSSSSSRLSAGERDSHSPSTALFLASLLGGRAGTGAAAPQFYSRALSLQENEKSFKEERVQVPTHHACLITSDETNDEDALEVYRVLTQEMAVRWVSIVKGGYRACHDLALREGLELVDHDLAACPLCAGATAAEDGERQRNQRESHVLSRHLSSPSVHLAGASPPGSSSRKSSHALPLHGTGGPSERSRSAASSQLRPPAEKDATFKRAGSSFASFLPLRGLSASPRAVSPTPHLLQEPARQESLGKDGGDAQGATAAAGGPGHAASQPSPRPGSATCPGAVAPLPRASVSGGGRGGASPGDEGDAGTAEAEGARSAAAFASAAGGGESAPSPATSAEEMGRCDREREAELPAAAPASSQSGGTIPFSGLIGAWRRFSTTRSPRLQGSASHGAEGRARGGGAAGVSPLATEPRRHHSHGEADKFPACLGSPGSFAEAGSGGAGCVCPYHPEGTPVSAFCAGGGAPGTGSPGALGPSAGHRGGVWLSPYPPLSASRATRGGSSRHIPSAPCGQAVLMFPSSCPQCRCALPQSVVFPPCAPAFVSLASFPRSSSLPSEALPPSLASSGEAHASAGGKRSSRPPFLGPAPSLSAYPATQFRSPSVGACCASCGVAVPPCCFVDPTAPSQEGGGPLGFSRANQGGAEGRAQPTAGGGQEPSPLSARLAVRPGAAVSVLHAAPLSGPDGGGENGGRGATVGPAALPARSSTLAHIPALPVSLYLLNWRDLVTSEFTEQLRCFHCYIEGVFQPSLDLVLDAREAAWAAEVRRRARETAERRRRLLPPVEGRANAQGRGQEGEQVSCAPSCAPSAEKADAASGREEEGEEEEAPAEEKEYFFCSIAPVVLSPPESPAKASAKARHRSTASSLESTSSQAMAPASGRSQRVRSTPPLVETPEAVAAPSAPKKSRRSFLGVFQASSAEATPLPSCPSLAPSQQAASHAATEAAFPGASARLLCRSLSGSVAGQFVSAGLGEGFQHLRCWEMNRPSLEACRILVTPRRLLLVSAPEPMSVRRGRIVGRVADAAEGDELGADAAEASAEDPVGGAEREEAETVDGRPGHGDREETGGAAEEEEEAEDGTGDVQVCRVVSGAEEAKGSEGARAESQGSAGEDEGERDEAAEENIPAFLGFVVGGSRLIEGREVERFCGLLPDVSGEEGLGAEAQGQGRGWKASGDEKECLFADEAREDIPHMVEVVKVYASFELAEILKITSKKNNSKLLCFYFNANKTQPLMVLRFESAPAAHDCIDHVRGLYRQLKTQQRQPQQTVAAATK